MGLELTVSDTLTAEPTLGVIGLRYPVPNDPQRQRQDDNASPEPEEEYIRVHWKLTSFSSGIVRLRRCGHIIFMQGRILRGED
jgi:hypothetical protein